MSLKEILEYNIFQTEKLTLSVYQLLLLLLMLIITSLVLKLVKKIIQRKIKRKNLNSSNTAAIFEIVKYVIWVVAIGIAIETVGIKFNILIASSAALLVGIGLGLQQVFMDYVSGFIILFEGIIHVNDVIELEDIVGEVKYIGLRTSHLETRDDYVIVVPNHKLVNETVVNWSHNHKMTRFNVSVGVAYGSDTRLVEKVLLDCAHEVETISKVQLPFVRFNNFGDSSLDFQLIFYTEDSFRVENTKSALRFKIEDKFRTHNIQIPFPQRDVYIKQSGL